MLITGYLSISMLVVLNTHVCTYSMHVSSTSYYVMSKWLIATNRLNVCFAKEWYLLMPTTTLTQTAAVFGALPTRMADGILRRMYAWGSEVS